MSAALRLVRGEGPVAAGELLGGMVRYPAQGTEHALGLPAEDLPAHLARLGPRPHATGSDGDALVDLVERVGLTGRGGAHFPAAVKWRGVLEAGGGGTVIANGAEGEPASAKDAALLQHRPHLVLDGLALAAEAVGAEDVVVWLHEGAHATHRSVTRALAERRAAGLAEPAVRVVTAPDRYLSGESSAVIRALSGGPALPELVRTLPVVSGVHGRPTLLHNVDTLARVGLLARTGAEAHRPTSLLTVVTPSDRRVVEVAADTSVADALDLAGWGDGRDGRVPPAAVLLGGYGGFWLPWSRVAGLPVDPAALRAEGLSLGAGIVIPLPAGSCGLTETARIVAYLAASSAGQCGPCLFGLRSVSDAVGALADRRAGRGELRRLDRFRAEIAGRGACRHPDGALRLVATALETFADDVREHSRRKRCQHRRTTSVVPVPEVG